MTTATTTNSMMLCYTVIISLIGGFILSVDAIRCHQCNSHLEEDCIKLRLITPRAPRDEQYLKECDGNETFCRKTVVMIDATTEKRIVRGCGKIETHFGHQKDLCFDADNEGFKQTVCACYEDGCNAAPSHLGSENKFVIFGLTGVCIALATLLRRSA